MYERILLDGLHVSWIEPLLLKGVCICPKSCRSGVTLLFAEICHRWSGQNIRCVMFLRLSFHRVVPTARNIVTCVAYKVRLVEVGGSSSINTQEMKASSQLCNTGGHLVSMHVPYDTLLRDFGHPPFPNDTSF